MKLALLIEARVGVCSAFQELHMSTSRRHHGPFLMRCTLSCRRLRAPPALDWRGARTGRRDHGQVPFSGGCARRLRWTGGVLALAGGIAGRPRLNCRVTAAPAAQYHVYDAVVVGGGVVGLSVLRELAVHGYSVALLEKEEHLVAGAASSGNSGIGCTGYDAPAGSLERALLRRAIERHPELMRSLGLSYQHVNKCGALVVAQSLDHCAFLEEVIHANRSAGDPEACELCRAEILQREPGLSRDVEGGVLVPREVVVEPWLIPIAYAHAAQQHGAEIFTDQLVVAAEHSPAPSTEGERDSNGVPPQSRWVLRCASGRSFHARTVINCAGLFGDDLESACLGEPAPYAIRPRKGQFVVFEPDLDGGAPLHVLQPVPTQYTKGVFVWKTVWGTVVVGPTAEDQESKSDRSVDAQTVDSLCEHGKALFPPLRTARIVGTYSGLRPATQHRDYQIRAVPDKDWISVAGIRSTGLTASPAIAEYVAFLYASMNSFLYSSSSAPPPSLFAPEYLEVLQKNVEYSHAASGTSVFASSKSGTTQPLEPTQGRYKAPSVRPPYPPVSLCPPARRANAAVPSLEELALDYAARGDGTVEIFGRTWLVTHGLTRLGLASLSRRLLQEQERRT